MSKFGLIMSVLFIIIFVVIINFSTKLMNKTNNDINTIKEVKNETIKLSINSYIKIIENQIVINSIDMDDANDIVDNTYKVTQLEELGVKVNRLHPTDGWVKILNSEVVDYSLLISYNDINYIANYDEEKTMDIIKEGNIKEL